MSEQVKISLDAIPLLCEGVDLKSLNFSPEEGFLLAQIDGRTKVRHLKELSGLSEGEVFRFLENLMGKGIIILHQPRAKAEAKTQEKKLKISGKGIIDFKTLPQGEQFQELVNKLVEIMDQVNYFQLLGVDEKASKEQVKKAYFQLSKFFHPDRYFRKVAPEFRHKLQLIFKRITIAYQVLSNEERKREYLTQLSEKGVEFAGEELQLEVEKKIYTGPKLKLGLKEEDKEKAKEEKLQKIVEKIKQTGLGGQFQKADRLYQLALEEIRKKNFKSARTNLKLAIQLDPTGGKRYQEELNRIDQLEQELRGEDFYEEGRAAERAGDYQRASKCYNEALKISPKNINYLYSLAQAMIKYLHNFEKGRALLIQLLEMDQEKADYFYLLGLAYSGLGQKRAAEVQLEKALKLDPKHREAQKELKALKRQ